MRYYESQEIEKDVFKGKKNLKSGMGNLSLKGFTLIEMIVVVTILSIVAVGITSSFVAGMKLWDRAKNTDFSRGEGILTLEIIAKELRQIVDTPNIKCAGQSQEISFPILSKNLIVKVIYRFDTLNKVLLGRRMGIEEILGKEEEIKYLERNILFAEDFSFEYLYFDIEQEQFIWTDAWDEDMGIFTAVKIKAKLRNDEITKTIFIPIAG